MADGNSKAKEISNLINSKAPIGFFAEPVNETKTAKVGDNLQIDVANNTVKERKPLVDVNGDIITKSTDVVVTDNTVTTKEKQKIIPLKGIGKLFRRQ